MRDSYSKMANGWQMNGEIGQMLVDEMYWNMDDTIVYCWCNASTGASIGSTTSLLWGFDCSFGGIQTNLNYLYKDVQTIYSLQVSSL